MAQAFPSLADLLKAVGLARTVIDALPPSVIPPHVKDAVDVFVSIADQHNVAPVTADGTTVTENPAPAPAKRGRRPKKGAPHIPDDGKI